MGLHFLASTHEYMCTYDTMSACIGGVVVGLATCSIPTHMGRLSHGVCPSVQRRRSVLRSQALSGASWIAARLLIPSP